MFSFVKVAEARRRAALDGLVCLRTVLLSRCSWERKPAPLNATRLAGDDATRDRGASSRELVGAGSREFVGASFNATQIEEVDGELFPFLARHAFFKVDASACERKEGKNRREMKERKESSGDARNVGERKEGKEREGEPHTNATERTRTRRPPSKTSTARLHFPGLRRSRWRQEKKN